MLMKYLINVLKSTGFFTSYLTITRMVFCWIFTNRPKADCKNFFNKIFFM